VMIVETLNLLRIAVLTRCLVFIVLQYSQLDDCEN